MKANYLNLNLQVTTAYRSEEPQKPPKDQPVLFDLKALGSDPNSLGNQPCMLVPAHILRKDEGFSYLVKWKQLTALVQLLSDVNDVFVLQLINNNNNTSF